MIHILEMVVPKIFKTCNGHYKIIISEREERRDNKRENLNCITNLKLGMKKCFGGGGCWDLDEVKGGREWSQTSRENSPVEASSLWIWFK